MGAHCWALWRDNSRIDLRRTWKEIPPMTKSTITRERARQIFLGNGPEPSASEERELARMALAAMDSESGCLPLDYLQGHKDGLEWAAQLAEANHPETGDWLYDDPIELAKAIRKGPDMPPAQPVADSEPVIVVGDDGGDALSYRRLIQSFEPGTKLYLHAQPAPAVPGKWIPVSERMPENDGAYLCWDNRYVTTYAFIFGAWQANQFVAKNITHWMPLPNPPKE
jgi:hypothetical protein